MDTVCITGANRGIGLALAQQYSETHHVYALCRQSSPELDQVANTTIITGVDINDAQSRLQALSQLPSLDILILNAGILEGNTEDLSELEQSIQHQLQTNAISPLIFAKQLIPLLSSGSKVMFMTSRMGSMADNSSGGLDGYRMSKAALNAGGKNLAHTLQADNIPVYLIHPGYVKTDMTNQSGQEDPKAVAIQIYNLLNKLTIKHTGEFFHANGDTLPW